jgi:hypothetical protein
MTKIVQILTQFLEMTLTTRHGLNDILIFTTNCVDDLVHPIQTASAAVISSDDRRDINIFWVNDN